MKPLNSSFQLDRQRVMVTGASSGFGGGICAVLDALGASLVLVGRNAGALQALNETLGNRHCVELVEMDKPDELPAWMEGVASRHGALSGLVHAAGVMVPKPLKVVTGDDWQRTLGVNLIAASQLTKGYRRERVCANGGSVVYIASVAGLVGQPAQSVYGASKGALIAMTRSLAVELAPQGIRVNCVAPGLIDVGMAARLKSSVSSENWARITAAYPLGTGTAEDVVWPVGFLLSSAARWITGIILTVDGGFSVQ